MLPKTQEIEDSSNLFEEEPKQLQGETQFGSPNKSSAIIGIIHPIFIFFRHNPCKTENLSSKPKLLAWCSHKNNKINIVELETKQDFANFDGVNSQFSSGSFFYAFHFYFNLVTLYEEVDKYTHVKEIANTGLVSVHHYWDTSSNLEVFDVSRKGQTKKIYSFEEVSGGSRIYIT